MPRLEGSTQYDGVLGAHVLQHSGTCVLQDCVLQPWLSETPVFVAYAVWFMHCILYALSAQATDAQLVMLCMLMFYAQKFAFTFATQLMQHTW